jgi:hypothetical protein
MKGGYSMRCSNCNEPLIEGDQFCANCGQPVAPPAPLTAVQAAASDAGKKKPRWLLIGGILLALLLCCVVVAGVYLMFPGQAGSSQPSQGNQEVSALQETVSAQEAAIASQETGLAQPAPQEAAPPQETAAPPNIHESGLNIWYDHTAMQGVRLVQVEASIPGEYIPWEYWPMHLSLEVQEPEGEIHIVPVATYVSMGDFANETISGLKSALESQSGFTAVDCIPTWDFPCPHQEMNTEIAYFDFQNGSGMRAVSVFAVQNTSAINNEALDYYYNGLTDDGLYYVYARFDLRHSSLSEDDWDVPLDVMTDIEALKEYVMGYASQLAASPDDYDPLLSDLDTAIQSLRVEVE